MERPAEARRNLKRGGAEFRSPEPLSALSRFIITGHDRKSLRGAAALVRTHGIRRRCLGTAQCVSEMFRIVLFDGFETGIRWERALVAKTKQILTIYIRR